MILVLTKKWLQSWFLIKSTEKDNTTTKPGDTEQVKPDIVERQR
jgi:hypothetical protein